MYTHILIPTDGSNLSELAVTNALQFAKAMKAKITALHGGVPFHILAADSEALTDTRRDYEKHARRKSDEIMSAIQKKAKNLGVDCHSRVVTNEHPYEAIIKAAEAEECDLIVMASHGRKGVKGLLLGSVTQKVLTHSRIPVLVYR